MTSNQAHDDLEFSEELIRQFDTPGPRYTSYPTAPYFHTGFDEADWVAVRIVHLGTEPIRDRLRGNGALGRAAWLSGVMTW